MRVLHFTSPIRGWRTITRDAVAAGAIVLLLAFAGFNLRAVSQDAPPAPGIEPPTQTEPTTNRADDADGREQRVLRQVVFRDRLTQTILDRAQEALSVGDAVKGIELLQEILDRPTDHFVWLARERRLGSARRQAIALLSSADAKTRETYEWTYARESRRLLETAKTAEDSALVFDVARRFFHTEAGFDATDWLATRWLDRGESALALRAWRSLSTDPKHRLRAGAAILRKMEVADRFLARDPGEPPREPIVHADVRTVDRFNDDRNPHRPPSEISQVVARAELPETSLASDRRRRTRFSVPYMTPAWRIDLSGESAAEVAQAVRRWESQQQRQDAPAVSVHSAVVIGDTVVFRGYDGIGAADAATGRRVWNCPTATSLRRASTEIQRMYATDGEGSSREITLNAMMNAYAGNSILGGLTTDGRRAFAVDAMEIRPKHAGAAAPAEGLDARQNPEQLSRSANRLIAIDVASSNPGDDGTVKPAWVVGGSVGAAQWFFRSDANDDGRVTADEFPGSADDFRRLDRNADGAIDKTEADDLRDGGGALRGHFFLGPPLALDGRLYAVTECDYRLNLVALRADTGEMLWIQGIGYVERPIDEDPLRYALACTPSHAAGVIVCPTQLGILVGVDAVDGSLLWTYYYGDEDVAQPNGDWSFVARRSFGTPGYRNRALVDGNRIIVLPRQSDWLHCIDLANGRGLWKIPRSDAEYIAAAADGVVMVVGERLCRGLSIADGAVRWSVRFGEAAGCGVPVGTDYLLPLANNRIAPIDIRTGVDRGLPARDWGFSIGRDESANDADDPAEPADPVDAAAENPDSRRPSNLLRVGSFIVSTSPQEMIAYPQADALLDALKQRLAGEQAAPEDVLLAAELELTLGNVAASRRHLSQVSLDGLAPRPRQRAEQLTRAVLHCELAAGTGAANDGAILRELEILSRTPRQRGRFLQVKSAMHVRRGELDAVLDASGAYAALDADAMLPSLSDDKHLMSPRSWLTATDDRIRARFDDASLAGVQSRVSAEQRAALASGDRRTLARFLSVYPSRPEADEVRLRLAATIADGGELQSAELLLLQSRGSPRPATVIAATRQLARLWDRVGFAEEAAALLFELEERTASKSSGGGNGREGRPGAGSLIEEFPADSLTRSAYRRLERAGERVSGVRVRQSLWDRCNGELAATFANAARPFVTRPASAFQLIDVGSSIHAKISIIDRLSGTVVDTLHVPTPYSGSSVATRSQVGHFLPLGSRAAMHGISLLEREQRPISGSAFGVAAATDSSPSPFDRDAYFLPRWIRELIPGAPDLEPVGGRPLWTTAPLHIAREADQTLPGPSGPTFCVFQARRHLFVVDPGTGKPLWERTDVDPQSGLAGDPIRGIFGDDEVLVVMGANRTDYTVYRTATGEELRQGRLDCNVRQAQERRAFGRCLLHFTADAGNRRLRIWDPRDDRMIYDRPAGDRLLWRDDAGEDEVAVISADGALEIVDGRSGAIRVALHLETADVRNAGQVVAFRDGNRYFVNLQPLQQPLETPRYSYCLGTDAVLPRADLRGDLWAIDRTTGKRLWKRTIPPRTVLRVPSLRLPFLVMLSLVGDRMNGNYRALLVEVVDATTGETLCLDDGRFRDQILQLTYHDDESRLRLWGKKSTLIFDLAKPAASGTQR